MAEIIDASRDGGNCPLDRLDELLNKTAEKLVCNCTGCIHDGTDECMHCMRAYTDCYESVFTS